MFSSTGHDALALNVSRNAYLGKAKHNQNDWWDFIKHSVLIYISRVLFPFADDEYIWSSYGLGPKQLKKMRQKKSKRSKFLGLITSGAHSVSSIFSNPSARKNNEYEISKGELSK